jgi:hypothetical protein
VSAQSRNALILIGARTRDLPGGGTIVAGLKDGCYGMVVVGADRKTAGTLAEAVFKD